MDGLAWHAVLRVGRGGSSTDLRAVRLHYRELEQQGLRFPVVEVQARYLRPVLYDDVLEVRTRLVSLGGARLEFAYEVRRDGTEGPLATGSTVHAALDSSGRLRRLPDNLRRRLA